MNARLFFWLGMVVLGGLALYNAWGTDSFSVIALGLFTAILAYQASKSPLGAITENYKASFAKQKAEQSGEVISKLLKMFEKKNLAQEKMMPLIEEMRVIIFQYGDHELIKAYLQFMAQATQHDPDSTEGRRSALHSMEQLFLAFRKAAGHDDSKLAKGSLMKMVINHREWSIIE